MIKKATALLIVLSIILSFTDCFATVDRTITTSNIQTGIDKLPQQQGKIWLYPAYTEEGNNTKWGYINGEGKFIIKPLYSSAEDFLEIGVARVSINGKSALIGLDGKYIVEPIYDSISNFSEGLAVAYVSNKSVVLDEKGRVVFSAQYQLQGFHEGISVVKKETNQQKMQYGYIDKKGKVIAAPKFAMAYDFKDGKAVVETFDGKTAIINRAGNVLKTFNCRYAGEFSEGVLVCQDNESEDDRNLGYLSVDGGNILTGLRFSGARGFEDGLSEVNAAESRFKQRWGLINKKGEFVIKPEYSSIDKIGEGLYSIGEQSLEEDWYVQEQFVKKALITKDGVRLTDFLYYDMGSFESGETYASDGTSTFFINKNGGRIKNLPTLSGFGKMTVQNDIIKAEIDEELIYLTKQGNIIWRSSDQQQVLDGGLQVKTLRYRPNRFLFIRYPEISNLPNKSVQGSINRKLKKLFIEENPVPQEEGDDGYYSNDEVNFRVDKNSGLLIVEQGGYYYPLGAAHGMPSLQYYHINLKNGRFYSLSDLFKKGANYKERLSAILKEKIIEESKKEDSMILSEDFGDINWEQNFIITKDCLQIYFYPYEIAAYAAGFPTFDISYDEIMDIIDTKGELWASFDKNPSKGHKEVEALRTYEEKMVEAINKNDFSIVEPCLVKGSSLYNSQKSLVPYLFNKKIKEKFIDFTAKGYKQGKGANESKVYVEEKVAIQYPGKEYETKTFFWVYTVLKEADGIYRLSAIEKWDGRL